MVDVAVTHCVLQKTRDFLCFSFHYDWLMICKHSVEAWFSVAKFQAVPLYFLPETIQFIVPLQRRISITDRTKFKIKFSG